MGFTILQGHIRKCKSDIIAKVDASQPHHNKNGNDANVYDSSSPIHLPKHFKNHEHASEELSIDPALLGDRIHYKSDEYLRSC